MADYTPPRYEADEYLSDDSNSSSIVVLSDPEADTVRQLIPSIVVVPPPQQQGVETAGSSTSGRSRYSKVTPWSKLPGPVVLSRTQTVFIKVKVQEWLDDLSTRGATTFETRHFDKLRTKLKSVQTSCFVDLERRHGPRGTSTTERQRYNLKSFTGPCLDMLRELSENYNFLPMGAKRIKLRTLADMLGRLQQMNHQSLYKD